MSKTTAEKKLEEAVRRPVPYEGLVALERRMNAPVRKESPTTQEENLFRAILEVIELDARDSRARNKK